MRHPNEGRRAFDPSPSWVFLKLLRPLWMLRLLLWKRQGNLQHLVDFYLYKWLRCQMCIDMLVSVSVYFLASCASVNCADLIHWAFANSMGPRVHWDLFDLGAGNNGVSWGRRVGESTLEELPSPSHASLGGESKWPQWGRFPKNLEMLRIRIFVPKDGHLCPQHNFPPQK